MDDGLVEMVVESVRVHMLSSRHVVILKEAARDRYLPIWIGPWEASAIAMKLQGLDPRAAAHPRPVRNDARGAWGADRPGGHQRARRRDFHARIMLEREGRTVEVDARPSDALALAVRSNVRIFAADAVLDQAALGGDGGLGTDEGEE